MTRQKVPFLSSFSCMVSFLTGFPNWSFDFLIREDAKSVASRSFYGMEIVLCHIKRTDLGTATRFNESSTIII